MKSTKRKTTAIATLGKLPKPVRPSTKFLRRHILSADTHGFVGRIYDLGVVTLSFDSYEDLAKHADCKYAVDVGDSVHRLLDRVESLNMAGHMLWLDPLPTDFRAFPVSTHEWLTIAADVFLMRYISVVDCALLVVNEVYELGLDRPACKLKELKKRGVPANVTDVLDEMLDDQGNLRLERNARIHHGDERGFTQDDRTFKIAALFEHRLNGITGNDQFGRRINLARMFREGLVELQREFNPATRILIRQLDRLYDQLWGEFEARFKPRIRASTHGLSVGGGAAGVVPKS